MQLYQEMNHTNKTMACVVDSIKGHVNVFKCCRVGGNVILAIPISHDWM